MSRIRLGIWGLGRMGFTHCRCFSAEADMHELVTGCDIEQVKMCRHHPYPTGEEPTGKAFCATAGDS